MSVVVIDSNVLIGASSRRDQHHDQGLAITQGIDQGSLPPARVTNYVIAEATGYVHERHRHDKAVELLDRLKVGAAFELVHTPKVDFTRADELFHADEQLSFVDATIVAYMEREDIEYLYSFDDDFDHIEHITRLNTADNPFG